MPTIDPFKPKAPPPPAPVPANTYTGPINNSINGTQQGADLVNANQAQAKAMGITLPGSTFKPPEQKTTLYNPDGSVNTQAGAGAEKKTTTGTTSTDPAADKLAEKQAQREQDDADFQTQAKAVQNTIQNIQNGTTPLTSGQQAQIDGLKQQFQAIIDDQVLINTGASGVGNIRGYQKGAAEYDPTFQVKTIGAIVSKGQQKIADINIKMASAVASLTQSFHDNDIKAVTEAWKTYKDAADKHSETLEATIKDAQDAIKEAQKQKKDAQDAEIAAAKVEYDTITKPIQDLAADAAKNGASPDLIAKINAAESVQEALNVAGDSLQTATGDVGVYLFTKRQAEREGKVPVDYETWYKSLEQQKLNSEIAKFSAQEGIRFNYDLALEKAKNALTNTPNPDYHGEFAATVKLAAQAGGTNAQRTQIKSDLEDFISQGDYKSAYAQVLSSASNKLTGANASNFQQTQQSYEAMKDMRQALKEYQAAGGDTNIFKGGLDAVQTKIGALVTDPKYASIAVRLNSAFYQYRSNVTGAAFSGPESASYASVLPSSGNTFALNMAKIDGAEAYLNGVVESTLKNTVGEGGIYIKQYAEADNNAQTQQVNLQDKMTQFRSSSPENEAMVAEMHAQFPDWSMDQIAEALQLK